MSELQSDNKQGISFVIPCLNESETLERVIREIRDSFANETHEILISDNGSTDKSGEIALQLGCRVIEVQQRGYGSALINGIKNARFQIVVMGDADGSYDFHDSRKMIANIRNGDDLVMGNRFIQPMEKGAMPFLNRYLGNPVLSFIGRRFFKAPIGDFHCGLRAFKKATIERLKLQSTGMEFASEMVLKAALSKIAISEVAINFRKDGRSRKPHLRPWRDGMRHLRLLFLFSPQYLFLTPALIFLSSGFILSLLGRTGSVSVGGYDLSYRTSVLIAALSIISSVLYGIQYNLHISQLRMFAQNVRPKVLWLTRFSFLLVFLGTAIVASDLVQWRDSGFSTLKTGQNLLLFTWGVSLIGVGLVQILFRVYVKMEEVYSRHAIEFEGF